MSWNYVKNKRRMIATARTSGLAESFRRKTREKKQKLEEEMEVKKRGREERFRVLESAGVVYYSDDDKSKSPTSKSSEGEDECHETFKIMEERKVDTRKVTFEDEELERQRKYEAARQANEDLFVKKGDEELEALIRNDDLFTKKRKEKKFGAPIDRNENLSIKKGEEEEKMEAPIGRNENLFAKKRKEKKFGAPTDRNENSFVKKGDEEILGAPIDRNENLSIKKGEEEKMEAPIDINENSFVKTGEEEESSLQDDHHTTMEPDEKTAINNPTRRTLYDSKDLRSNGPNAILMCKICVQKGERNLFSSKETLKSHLSTVHAFIFDWIESFW